MSGRVRMTYEDNKNSIEQNWTKYEQFPAVTV